MTFLQQKMKNLIGKEIQTTFGTYKVIEVTNKHVILKDMTEQEIEVELWRFNL